MKKIFMFIAGVAAAMTMQAATYTEAALITMTCDGGSEMQELELYVNPALTSPVTVQNLASTYEVGQVNMYASYNNGKYSSFKANAISNLPVAIVTNRRDASYTFTFNVPIITDGLTLTDLRSNEGVKTMPITHNGSYTFSVGEADGYEANKNITIADRFIINYVPAPVYDAQVTTNEFGWASFSYAGDLAPVDADAQTLYKGAISGDVLALDEVDYVKAGQGVLVKGEANTTYYFAVDNGSADFAGNDLRPTSEYNYPMENVFVLKGEAFLEYIGTTDLKANKAFIQLPAQSGASAPKRIRMVINGTTAVDNVEAESAKAEKFVEDGQVLIKRGEIIYNVQGQIVK